MEKALVLSSGGVDSTTCIGMAVAELGSDNVASVSIFYGQKHQKELDQARKIASFYGIFHDTLDLSSIFRHSDCPLLQGSARSVPHQSYAEQIRENEQGMVSTYVPFRNGLMLSAAASLAASLWPDAKTGIWLGAHADDAAGNAYADCSAAFTEAMGMAIRIGTYDNVCLKAPLVQMNKAQVVATGLKLGVPYELTWSCYEGEEKPCGACGTCLDRAAAFAANGIPDPALK
ncbi:MAG: 7-cyano-7-deazaguanine synthase QueC [Desulfovibrionaceae bacterium]|nr:7-cyano-7-deazaguanine synthase QueC [Desulfovibrionaceae bacterium]